MRIKYTKYYVDGSTSQAGNWIIVTDGKGNVLLNKKINKTVKTSLTNNETEYIAILECLKMCEERSAIYSDSKLCVEQILGNYKINEEHLKPYREEAYKLLKEKKSKIFWISREINLAGHHLEKFTKTNARKRYRKSNAIRSSNS
jgi:ribonuclease HI